MHRGREGRDQPGKGAHTNWVRSGAVGSQVAYEGCTCGLGGCRVCTSVVCLPLCVSRVGVIEERLNTLAVARWQ